VGCWCAAFGALTLAGLWLGESLIDWSKGVFAWIQAATGYVVLAPPTPPSTIARRNRQAGQQQWRSVLDDMIR
jgi:hypothetical protein